MGSIFYIRASYKEKAKITYLSLYFFLSQLYHPPETTNKVIILTICHFLVDLLLFFFNVHKEGERERKRDVTSKNVCFSSAAGNIRSFFSFFFFLDYDPSLQNVYETNKKKVAFLQSQIHFCESVKWLAKCSVYVLYLVHLSLFLIFFIIKKLLFAKLFYFS